MKRASLSTVILYSCSLILIGLTSCKCPTDPHDGGDNNGGTPPNTNTSFGRALVLNGENDYVVVPHSNSLNLSASSFTIEAWVKPSSRVYYKWIIGKATSNSSLDYLLGFDIDGHFRFSTRNLANDIRGSLPIWNQWYHVAGVQDVENNMVYLYVNGQLDASATLRGVPNANTGNVLIGVRTHTNNINILAEYLDGTVDDIRIWKKARTQAEILQGYQRPIQGTETMLEAYWNFDEEQGSTVYDATDHGHNGTFGQGAAPARTISTVPTK